MFNLLISSNPDAWSTGTFELERSRVAVEYTADEISERYKNLSAEVIEELKTFPTIFATEHEQTDSRIGFITEIRLRQTTVMIHFQFDEELPPLVPGTLETLRSEFDLGRWELGRTHWAIKDEPLFEILGRRKILSQEQIARALQSRVGTQQAPIQQPAAGERFNQTQIFIVHGQDEISKLEVSTFVSSLGLEPIILHQQASLGQTIIEKIEHYSNVGFGIVLYTPCDVGHKAGTLTLRYRARQNVVFEHGFLIGKLGRARVAALVKGDVETPNDISGVVYVGLDEAGTWKDALVRELRAAEYNVAN